MSPISCRASTAFPAINLNYFEIDAAVVKLIPQETAKRYQILPLSRVGASLTIAMVDPTNVFAMDDIKFMTGFNIEPVVASETAIMDAIEKAYSEPAGKEDDLDSIVASINDADTDVELQAEKRKWVSPIWRRPPKKHPSSSW